MAIEEQVIHDLFPHRDGRGRPSYRQGQFEVIRDALAALDDASIEDVIVEAPTGAGKTSIAVTVARVVTRGFAGLRAELRGEETEFTLPLLADDQAHMVTSMKMLQDAYLGDDAQIALVKGKGSYECRHMPRLYADTPLTCDDAEIVYGHTCDEQECPYLQARHRARWSAIALHNFDSFLWQAVRGNVFLPRRLLTLDEAHNAEEKIRQFTSFVLGPDAFARVGLPWAPPPADIDRAQDIGDWCRVQLERLAMLALDVDAQLKDLRREAGDRVDPQMATLVRLQRRASALFERLNRCLATLEKTEWSVDTKLNGDLVFEAVDAGYFVPKTFYKYGRQRLHLSATFLNGAGAYTRAVRLRMPRTRWLTTANTFPKERRPIIFRSAGPLGLEDWKVNLPTAIGEFKRILAAHPRERGVVHCTSYDMARDIAEAMAGDRRLLIYERNERADTLANFMGNKPLANNVVLLAVGLREGFDFKYDLCRFQVIMRVPYPVLTRCVRAIGNNDRVYYPWRTALALVQAYGRGMRAADDRCVTYVLDARFANFVDKQGHQLPAWFKEAISWES